MHLSLALLPVYLLTTLSPATAQEKSLSGPQIFEDLFVPALHQKFINEAPSTLKFEHFVSKNNGSLVLDHAATRTPNPQTFELITRIAGAFGLSPQENYTFTEKKLIAHDLQFPGKQGFKWFCSLIEYQKLSPKAITAIEEDIRLAPSTLSPKAHALLTQLEKNHALPESQAHLLVHEILYKFCSRQGPPLKKSTIELLQTESPESLNALLQGPDFNHITYSLNHINIPSWYGLEIIEALESSLRQEGFEMLPQIQGKPGSILRQTSTKADKRLFPIEGPDGQITYEPYPAKFLEFIQRGPERDASGNILFSANYQPQLFQGFLKDNANKIYESTTQAL